VLSFCFFPFCLCAQRAKAALAHRRCRRWRRGCAYRWSLALNPRNLTNKTCIANCGYGNCYDGYPRTAVATATYRW
jgi:hypothetical protein